MLYHVSRGGQNYGPYTPEDLQRYVASGNILPSDLAKSDEMPEWVPVSQVLGASMPAGPAAVVTSQANAAPAYPSTMVPYPDPPNLHWALVLVLGFFTCGLFFTVWDIVQSVWMRKVAPRSNALFLYIAEFVISLISTAVRMVLVFAAGPMHRSFGLNWGLGLLTFAVAVTLIELARFDMRRYMEEHFNGPEPIGLTLGGVMTFFFGSLYFQYHFTRINELKRLARYRGAAI